jgi:hypothetical protein
MPTNDGPTDAATVAARPRIFDVVEFLVPARGQAAGGRGTVVVEGIERSVVAVHRSDGVVPTRGALVEVENAAIRVVEARRHPEPLGA